MARYYPSNKLPPVRYHGIAHGSWSYGFDFPTSPVQEVYEFVTDKTTAGVLRRTRNAENNQGVPADSLLATFVSPPLDAQTISGTFQCCFRMLCNWQGTGLATAATGRMKVHIYIAVGQTREVRHTLLDNYLDTVDLTTSGIGRWQTLASAQALTSGDALEGDVVVIEYGGRFVTISPLINPITYPPTEWAFMQMQYTGNAGNADAVNGDTSSSRESWLEFSNGLSLLPVSAPPANDACADAIVIASLPYASDDIDTSESTDTKRAVWWTWTAPSNMRVCLRAAGTTYVCTITLMTGGCGALVTSLGLEGTSDYGPHRSQAMRIFDAVMGTQYWFRLTSESDDESAANSGGCCRFEVVEQGTPQTDDLYLPSAQLFAFREGVLNMGKVLDQTLTSCAFDFSLRPMLEPFHPGSPTRSVVRCYVGLHNFELVEIFTASDLDVGLAEIDYIGDPWSVPIVGVPPAKSYITQAGMLHQSWFGNGYLYVFNNGTTLSGNPAAYYGYPSSNDNYSALKSISAIDGDNQPGAPFADVVNQLAYETPNPTGGAGWSIAFDEVNSILYYVSGGFYFPGGTEIRTFNVATQTAGPIFATLAPQGPFGFGLRGLVYLADGGLLVCNGNVVQRLNSSGTVIQTFTPSIALDSQLLVDVCLTQDATAFWVIDEQSTRIFKFDIASGTELMTFQPYTLSNSLIQMAIYQPLLPPPPPGDCPGETGPSSDGLPYNPPDFDPCEGSGTASGSANTGA